MGLTQITTGGVDDNINIDSNTLKVDGTNNRVGIGTTSPTRQLQVSAATAQIGLTSSDSTLCEYLFGDVADDNVGRIRYEHATNNLNFWTNASERMRIDSSGNLGVGTTSPGHKLEVNSGTSDSVALFKSSDTTARIILRDNGSTFGGYVGVATEDMFFHTNGTERLRIDSSGRIGIGTTSPSAPLDVRGTGLISRFESSSSSAIFRIANTETNDCEFIYTSDLAINVGGSERMRIDSSGRIFFNETSSDLGHKYILSGNESADVAAFQYNSNSGTYLAISTGAPNGNVEIKADARSGSFPPLTFKTGASERMRIDSSGRLGIATSSPDAELHVGGSTPHIDIGPDDSNRCKIGYSGSDMHFGVSASAGDFHFKKDVTSTGNPADDGSVVAQFLSQGRLKVTSTGGSGSAYHTNVNFSSIHQGLGGNVIAGFESSHASDPYGIVVRFSGDSPDNNSNYFIECNDTTTTRFQVLSDGDVRNHDNSYGSTSDEKLKQDIVDAGSQWDDLKDLRVRKFKFKSDVAAYGDEAKVLIGLVAQEAELVSPGLVTDSPDRDDDGNDLGTVTKSVRYSVLYMKAVKALQEAMDRIETLEAKVAALEAAE